MANLPTLLAIAFLYLVPRRALGSFEQCGSTVRGQGDLQSHGFPNAYPANYECDWTIEAGPDDSVDLSFSYFNVEQSEQCRYDYFQLYAMGQSSPRICGEGVQKISPTGSLSLKGTVRLFLKSDNSDHFPGFSVRYAVTPKETDEPQTTTRPPETTTPSAVVSCADDPCQNGGDCVDIDVGEVVCFCTDGFEGDFCEINIDECVSSPCENGGTCIDGINEFRCECPDGFIGIFCGVDVDECQGDPCKNGGTCVDGANSFECVCVTGYTGWNCNEDIDECTSGPCQNMGVCEDKIGYYSCVCYPGYTGVNCEIAPLQTTTVSTTTQSTPLPMRRLATTTPAVMAFKTTPLDDDNPSYDAFSTASYVKAPRMQNTSTPSYLLTTSVTGLKEVSTSSIENIEEETDDSRETPGLKNDSYPTGFSPVFIVGVSLGAVALLALIAAIIWCKCFSPSPTKVKPTGSLLTTESGESDQKDIRDSSPNMRKLEFMDNSFADNLRSLKKPSRNLSPLQNSPTNPVEKKKADNYSSRRMGKMKIPEQAPTPEVINGLNTSTEHLDPASKYHRKFFLCCQNMGSKEGPVISSMTGSASVDVISKKSHNQDGKSSNLQNPIFQPRTEVFNSRSEVEKKAPPQLDKKAAKAPGTNSRTSAARNLMSLISGNHDFDQSQRNHKLALTSYSTNLAEQRQQIGPPSMNFLPPIYHVPLAMQPPLISAANQQNYGVQDASRLQHQIKMDPFDLTQKPIKNIQSVALNEQEISISGPPSLPKYNAKKSKKRRHRKRSHKKGDARHELPSLDIPSNPAKSADAAAVTNVAEQTNTFQWNPQLFSSSKNDCTITDRIPISVPSDNPRLIVGKSQQGSQFMTAPKEFAGVTPSAGKPVSAINNFFVQYPGLQPPAGPRKEVQKSGNRPKTSATKRSIRSGAQTSKYQTNNEMRKNFPPTAINPPGNLFSRNNYGNYDMDMRSLPTHADPSAFADTNPNVFSFSPFNTAVDTKAKTFFGQPQPAGFERFRQEFSLKNRESKNVPQFDFSRENAFVKRPFEN